MLPFLFFACRDIDRRRKENLHYMPMLAMMGAAVFTIAVWHIPVPVTGSSSHPVGTPMAAIIIGPLPTVVISVIALILHTFVAHGGILTLGANTVSMGIVGTFSGFAVYKVLYKRYSIFMSVGLAGLTGSLLVYLTTAMELALSLNPENVLRAAGIYFLGFLPTQIPLGVLEFIFTGYMVRFVLQRRPDLFPELKVKVGGLHG